VTPYAPVAACLVALLLIAAAAGADEADRPEILQVAVPRGIVAGHSAQARLTCHVPLGNIVAVIQVVEDLEGARRVTTQPEIDVIAAAFGREEGDLLEVRARSDMAGPR
jgi:hypothetical protein